MTSVARFWSLVVPFILWLGLHRWGAIGPSIDNQLNYRLITYYFSSLAQGIMPLWDPYRSWGWPDVIDPMLLGNLNPLYLIIPLLKLFGMPELWAFNIFLLSSYWIGLTGFYFLVRRLTGKELPALLAYAMLMFSLLGELLFCAVVIPLILFSTIWFFYFLVSFFQADNPQQQKKYFCGLVFSSMIIVVTYLPVFFLVVFSSVITAVLFFGSRMFGPVFKKSVFFARANPGFLITGFAALALACVPGLKCYSFSKSGQVIFSLARNGFEQSKGLGNLSLEMINNGALTAQMTLGELFSDLDMGTGAYFYVTIFLFIILTLGLFTRITTAQRIIFFAGFFVFLIALADVTPVHAFLYKHIFIFRLIRNLYFLGPFLIAFLIIAGTTQFQAFLESRPEKLHKRFWYAGYILFIHILWAFFLLRQEHVIWTSYATLISSALLLCFYAFGVFDRRRNWFLAGFLLVVAVQPIQVISSCHLLSRAEAFKQEQMNPRQFTYMRPLRGEDPKTEQGFQMSFKKMKDESGFFDQGYYGTSYSFLLYSQIPPELLANYVHYKFVVYDRVTYMDGEHPDWPLLGVSLASFVNNAWVHDGQALRPAVQEGSNFSNQALAVSGPLPQLEVKDFSVNSVKLRTNFSTRKFLVFNDSYYPGWRVFMNGQKEPLYRVNIAFKGVWVDSGRQDIEFKFGSVWEYGLYWGLTLLFLAWGIYLVFLFIKDKKE